MEAKTVVRRRLAIFSEQPQSKRGKLPRAKIRAVAGPESVGS